MTPGVFRSVAEFKAAEGKSYGPTDWLVLTQHRIDQFAEATGDHQWIHVDVERAEKGPFGATVAHGYLTLGLVNCFLPLLIEAQGLTMGVNYGCDKVRFPNVVRAGARIRGRAEVIAVQDVPGGAQVKTRVTIEIDGESKPGCVADTLSRYYFS